MQKSAALAVAFACSSIIFGQGPAPIRPKAGKVQIFKESDLKPGMKGYAWTVLSGSEPEAIPIEIVGILKNQWGPKQDIILAKMGGKAIRTNVAGGMSGSPVYFDGKLAGALAFRIGEFSKEPIAGVTPIADMLEINALDRSPAEEAAADVASLKRMLSRKEKPEAGKIPMASAARPG